VEGTRRALSDYGAQQVAEASRPATAQMRALAAAAVVSEALTRHAEFFAATR
jgi:hypothetical protein